MNWTILIGMFLGSMGLTRILNGMILIYALQDMMLEIGKEMPFGSIELTLASILIYGLGECILGYWLINKELKDN